MAWHEEFANHVAQQARDIAERVAEEAPSVLEAAGSVIDEKVREAGQLFGVEVEPSLKDTTRMAWQWAEHDAYPFLRDNSQRSWSWLQDDVLPLLSKISVPCAIDIKHPPNSGIGHWTSSQIIPDWVLLLSGTSLALAGPQLLVAPFLSALGFTAERILADSIAALIHGLIGNVEATSLFATLQSAGAGGRGMGVIQNILLGLISALYAAHVAGKLDNEWMTELLEHIVATSTDFLRTMFSTDDGVCTVPGS